MGSAPLSFRILAWSDLYRGDWVVVREHDQRIMTTGSVWDCTRWVRVWGPVQGLNKPGSRLSSRAEMPACVLTD